MDIYIQHIYMDIYVLQSQARISQKSAYYTCQKWSVRLCQIPNGTPKSQGQWPKFAILAIWKNQRGRVVRRGMAHFLLQDETSECWVIVWDIWVLGDNRDIWVLGDNIPEWPTPLYIPKLKNEEALYWRIKKNQETLWCWPTLTLHLTSKHLHK